MNDLWQQRPLLNERAVGWGRLPLLLNKMTKKPHLIFHEIEIFSEKNKQNDRVRHALHTHATAMALS